MIEWIKNFTTPVKLNRIHVLNNKIAKIYTSHDPEIIYNRYNDMGIYPFNIMDMVKDYDIGRSFKDTYTRLLLQQLLLKDDINITAKTLWLLLTMFPESRTFEATCPMAHITPEGECYASINFRKRNSYAAYSRILLVSLTNTKFKPKMIIVSSGAREFILSDYENIDVGYVIDIDRILSGWKDNPYKKYGDFQNILMFIDIMSNLDYLKVTRISDNGNSKIIMLLDEILDSTTVHLVDAELKRAGMDDGVILENEELDMNVYMTRFYQEAQDNISYKFMKDLV